MVVGAHEPGRRPVRPRDRRQHVPLPTGDTELRGEVFQIRGNYALGEGYKRAGGPPLVWNLTTGAITTYPKVSLNAVAGDGTIVGEATSSSGAYTSIPLVGRDGQLQRLPTGHGDSPQVHMDAVGITDDGHTILGIDRTPVNTDGPYSQVALVWHC